MTMIGPWPQGEIDAEGGWDIEHFLEHFGSLRELIIHSQIKKSFTDDVSGEDGDRMGSVLPFIPTSRFRTFHRGICAKDFCIQSRTSCASGTTRSILS